MMVPGWVRELAAAFWAEVGQVEPFPRQLRHAISLALPLSVVYLPRLRLAAVRDWLQFNRVPCPCPAVDRALRGCLLARAGQGFLFIDGTDPEDEQRFTLAHELAHFLRDYWQPRRQACRRLGPQVLAVCDGQRPATAAERVDALLARVPLGFHVHLLERDEQQGMTAEIEQAEAAADLLAYELLAPAEVVCRLLSTAPGPPERAAVMQLLQRDYGLPASAARAYSACLVPADEPAARLRRLGLLS